MNYYEGKSSVNAKRLVQNIAAQYPFEPERAAILELIANSLDAKASLINIMFDKNRGILEVSDDGVGMDKRQFREYHDFAASTKERGEGIGFAGQGAKLALNFCRKIISETRSANYRAYSEWYLKGNDAPYKINDGRLETLDHIGTKVTLYLNQDSVSYYSESLIKETIYEHYFPLIDLGLSENYKSSFYKDGIKILLNGEEIVEPSIESYLEDKKEIIIRMHSKPKAVGFFGKIKDEEKEVIPGIMICTYGKVIERTYFKKEPKDKEKIIGWIEAPYLIEAVTTDKCRFQKGNKIWEGFFRKAQFEFNRWLEEKGFLEKSERKKSDYTSLEKEINSILKIMPELSFFGNTTVKEVSIPDKNGELKKFEEGIQRVPGTMTGETSGEGVPISPGPEDGKAPSVDKGEDILATPRPRTIRGGIRITEDEKPDLAKLSWFDGETVTINKAHSAFNKAKMNGLLNYHIINSVVMSLIEFSLEREPAASYQKVFELHQNFFKIWGER